MAVVGERICTGENCSRARDTYNELLRRTKEKIAQCDGRFSVAVGHLGNAET